MPKVFLGTVMYTVFIGFLAGAMAAPCNDPLFYKVQIAIGQLSSLSKIIENHLKNLEEEAAMGILTMQQTDFTEKIQQYIIGYKPQTKDYDAIKFWNNIKIDIPRKTYIILREEVKQNNSAKSLAKKFVEAAKNLVNTPYTIAVSIKNKDFASWSVANTQVQSAINIAVQITQRLSAALESASSGASSSQS